MYAIVHKRMLDLNIWMSEPKIANYSNILIKAHKQKIILWWKVWPIVVGIIHTYLHYKQYSEPVFKVVVLLKSYTSCELSCM